MKILIILRKLLSNYIIILLYFLIIFDGFTMNLKQAMSEAYKSSPELLALREKLKANNEKISKILGENRPKINLDSSIGYDRTDTLSTSSVEKTQYNKPRSLTLGIKQNIYDSGKKAHGLKKHEAEIFAIRAELFSEEQSILLKTAKSYVNLYQTIELNKIAKNNYNVLRQHLQATQSRFEVGEVTITDLAQAKARFLKSSANEIKSKGDIEIERSNFYSLVGKNPPSLLSLPNNNYSIPNSLKETIEISLKNNPKIISYGLKKKASFFEISLAATDLLPKLDLNLSAQKAWDPNTFFSEYQNFKVDLNLIVPFYNGGINYANVRQKKYLALEQSKILDNKIKMLVKEIEVVWFSLQTFKNQIKAIKASIEASQAALKGVKEEAKVGTRTTLDVLDAEQETLQENIELLKVNNNIFNSTFELLEKMGRLSPKSLNLNIVTKDYNDDYEAVKKIWLGFDG